MRLSQVVHRVLAPEEHAAFLRRLVFDLAAGNGDAHLKNWSLLYLDPRHPTLAPCYDLVATLLYVRDERPALAYPGAPGFQAVDRSCFRKLLRQTGDDTAATWSMLREASARIRSAWRELRPHLELTRAEADALEAHMGRVPLLTEL